MSTERARYGVNPSKAQYSFPKLPRFQAPRGSLSDRISYDIPQTLSTRACSFGYGKKHDFTIAARNTGDPSQFSPSSDFNSAKPHGQASSFGLSRDKCKVVQQPGTYVSDPKIPGPGQYQTRPEAGSSAAQFTMRARQRSIDFSKTAAMPGPGFYATQIGQHIGNSVLSTKRNDSVPSFAPLSSKRFGKETTKHISPGPATYGSVGNLGENSIVSKYTSSLRNLKFTEKRTINSTKQSEWQPGPGTYTVAGDFGEPALPLRKRRVKSLPKLKKPIA